MKTENIEHQRGSLAQADAYTRQVPGGRLVIYAGVPSEHRVMFWLAFQPTAETPSGYTVRGQLYLDKDGRWREPHGAKYRRHFSTPSAAIKHANNLNFATP